MPPISWTSKWRWPSVRLAGLAAGREGRHQDVVERLVAVGELLLELGGARPQRLVGELLELLLQRVDLRDARLIGLDAALVGRAENLAGERADHAGIPFRGPRTPVYQIGQQTAHRTLRNRPLSRQTVRTFIGLATACRNCEQLSSGGKRRLAGRIRPDLRRDRSGLTSLSIGEFSHVLFRIGRFGGHCKGEPIARLSGAFRGRRGRINHSKDSAMISLNFRSRRAPCPLTRRRAAPRSRPSPALALLILPVVTGCGQQSSSSSSSASADRPPTR